MWKEKIKKEEEEDHLTEPSEEKNYWIPQCRFNYGNAIENRVTKTKNT